MLVKTHILILFWNFFCTLKLRSLCNLLIFSFFCYFLTTFHYKYIKSFSSCALLSSIIFWVTQNHILQKKCQELESLVVIYDVLKVSCQMLCYKLWQFLSNIEMEVVCEHFLMFLRNWRHKHEKWTAKCVKIRMNI